jgi:hypothetical protein
MATRGAWLRAPYLAPAWVTDTRTALATVVIAAATASGHDVWRALHGACVPEGDVRAPLAAAWIGAEILVSLALAAASLGGERAEQPGIAVGAWAALDALVHATRGVTPLVARVLAVGVAACGAIELRRDPPSHESHDRFALSCATVLACAGLATWAPEIADGEPLFAWAFVVVPPVVVAFIVGRLVRRRAWLRGVFDARVPGWRVAPGGIGGEVTLGLSPLLSTDAVSDAELASWGAPRRDPYRAGEVPAAAPPVALVPAPESARDPAIPRVFLAAVIAALGASVVAMRALAADAGPPLPAMSASTTFQIESSGAEPRAPLRYAGHVGRCEHGTTNEESSRQTTVDGIPRWWGGREPGGRSTLVAAPVRALSNGNLRTRVTVQSIRLDENEASPEAQAEVSARSGLVVESEMTPFGENRGTLLEFSPGTSEESREELQELLRARRGFGAAFPPDALGPGAKWRATRTTSEAGITSTTTFEYTLVRREGDVLTIEKTFETQASSDYALTPLPGERHFKLRSFSAKGEAKETCDLRSLTPISEVVDVTEEVDCDVRDVLEVHRIEVTQKRHVVTTRDVARDGD